MGFDVEDRYLITSSRDSKGNGACVRCFLKEDETLIDLQDARLSQKDRAAGCIIVFAKSRRQELGDNILRKL